MKDYLVTSDYGQYDNMWIVFAKDAKDAIQQVWEKYIVPMNEDIKEENKRDGWDYYRTCKKSELCAKSIGSLHNSNGKIIRL